MSGGLVALLDDVAAIARAAAASVDDVALAASKASAKAAGVVIDDTAVTPQYLSGIHPSRELPMVKRIAIGSIRNKLIFILPALLLLSWLAPWILTPLLMLGGTYLCYEGAHKVWERLRGHAAEKETPVVAKGADAEDSIVRGAITTDFILSTEIMVISLASVTEQSIWIRIMSLIGVALLITALVYGVVAIIVKMDDVGLKLAGRERESTRRFGEAMVKAMPKVLSVITIVGTLAMLWVGGHLFLQGLYDLGWHVPLDLVHHLEDPVHGIAGVGPTLAWFVETLCSLLFGLVWGLVFVGIMALLPFGKHHDADPHEVAEARADAAARTKVSPES